MTDETTPKRVRGLKEREAAYRAGYQDGMRDAVQEIEARQAMDHIREARMAEGFKRLHAAATSAPKRARRTKAEREAARMAESADRVARGLAPYVPRS